MKLLSLFFLIFFALNAYGQEQAYEMDIIVLDEKENKNNIAFDTLYEIIVSGVNLTFSQNSMKDFYEFKGAKNIKKLSITANEIVLLEPIVSPDTEVYITCDKLIFNYSSDSTTYGQIVNTPLKHFKIAADQFKPGADGLATPKIKIVAASILDSVNLRPLIVSNGGEGQDGGAGRNGKAGNSMPIVSCGCVCDGKGTPEEAKANVWKNLVYYYNCGSRSYGSKSWPGDGENAIAGGKPGTGGNGGSVSIFTNSKLDTIWSIEGGSPGKKANAIPYSGGAAGEPQYARWFSLEGDRAQHPLHISKKGLDAPNPIGNQGSKGQFLIGQFDKWNGRNSHWFRFIRNQLKSALVSQDLLVFNQYYNLVFPYISDLKNYKYTDTLIRNEQFDIPALLYDIVGYKNNIDQNLDYYDNPINWAPALSFEYNLEVFEQEIENAIKELYLCKWVYKEKSTLESRLNALSQLTELKKEEVILSQNQIKNNLANIPILQNKAFEVEHLSDSLYQELLLLEREFKLLAENTVDERKHKQKMFKLLKTASVLLKSSPAGQPYTTAIGTGIEIINNYSYGKDKWDSYHSLKSIGSSIKDIDWEARTVSWEEYRASYESLDKVESAKKLYSDFVKPLESDLQEMRSTISGSRMKDTEMNAELQALKDGSALFQSLATSIESLTRKRKELIIEIENLVLQIEFDVRRIQLTENNIAKLNYDIFLRKDFKYFFETGFLSKLEEDAQKRLSYYQYVFIKAYEYRFLQDYPSEVNIDLIIDEIGRVVSINQNFQLLSSEQKENLISLYKSTLRNISSAIIKEYNSGKVIRRTKKYIKLSKSDLNRLNQGEAVYLNMSKYFSNGKEINLRLVDVNVKKWTINKSSDNVEFAELDISFTHEGNSTISDKNKTYLFSHYNRSGLKRYKWGARYSVHVDLIDKLEISSYDNSLLKSLARNDEISDINAFSRPGLIAEYKVEIELNSPDLMKIESTNIVLELIYDKQ